MLEPTDIMEELSLAYVSAVVAMAGFAVEIPKRDKDSIDLRVCARGVVAANATLESPEIGVQLKSWKVAAPLEPTFSYALKQKNYDDLRGKRMVPRILVIFTMPEDASQWLLHDEHRLVLQRCAYWTSLEGLPETTNTTSTTVTMDRANLFDPEAVKALLTKAAREEPLS
jgi:hypothetical protein